MNRGIEQNIDASQFEIFSEYWAQSLNDENFQQSFEDIRGRMIRSISSGTTREADELRTGMERVTLEDAFLVYRGNFLHANHLSNPLQLGVIYLPINIASTQSNAPENRLIQDQVANDNNDQREETQLIQQQRGRGL